MKQDGPTALQMIKASPPDLILLDIEKLMTSAEMGLVAQALQ